MGFDSSFQVGEITISSLRVEEYHNTPLRVGEDHNFSNSFSSFSLTTKWSLNRNTSTIDK
jgi:hypothetical protein